MPLCEPVEKYGKHNSSVTSIAFSYWNWYERILWFHIVIIGWQHSIKLLLGEVVFSCLVQLGNTHLILVLLVVIWKHNESYMPAYSHLGPSFNEAANSFSMTYNEACIWSLYMYHHRFVSPVQHSWSVEVGDTNKGYSPVWVSCHFKSRFWIGQLSSGYVRGLCWYCYLLVVVHKNDSDYIKMTFDYWFLFEALLKDKKKCLCETVVRPARGNTAPCWCRRQSPAGPA